MNTAAANDAGTQTGNLFAMNPRIERDDGARAEAELRLQKCRRAFRKLHGLSPAPEDAVLPPEAGGDLLPWARRHRVLGLLYAGGEAGESPAWRSAAYGQAVNSARLAAEAERLYERLAPSVKNLRLVKGPALAAQAWPDLGLRAFDDLDWRCARAAGPALDAALRDAGYRPEISDDPRRGHYWHFGWGVAYLGPGNIRIEANYRSFPPHWPWPVGDDPADSGVEIRLDHGVVRAPSPAEHLALACGHALWHGGERLAWIADIAGLLARNPEAFARAIAATRGFARRALRVGAGLADALFGPGLLRSPPAPDAAERMFLEQLRRGGGVSDAERRRLHRSLLSPFERVLYVARRALTPGDGDFRRRVFAPALRPLYWLYRPLRAARR